MVSHGAFFISLVQRFNEVFNPELGTFCPIAVVLSKLTIISIQNETTIDG